MTTTPALDQCRGVLVSDFDGTMTQHDFYKLAIESLLPADVPDYWAQYRSGDITHFEALRLYFSSIKASEEDVLSVVRRMDLDPQLPAAVDRLRAAGWRLIVTSAGCAWYIEWLLKSVGVELEVHANPGRFEAGRGLLMQMPKESPFWSPALGVDKVGVVRSLVDQGQRVAFAGDGFPDVEPARLVPGELRFARGDLASVLDRDGLSYHTYHAWSDIAANLLKEA